MDSNLNPDEVRTSRPRPLRESTSRKKACDQCSSAKVRCDHKKPRCTRCETRSISCEYAASQRGPTESGQAVGQGELYVPRASSDSQNALSVGTIGLSSPNTPSSHDSDFISSSSLLSHGPRNALLVQSHDGPTNIYWSGGALSFANIDLICTVDSTRIGNRWLGDFIPAFNQRVKNLSPGTILFISRVFKSYPSKLLKAGHLPPFIHASQLSGSEAPTPLANCLSLVRMWGGQVRGSETMVREIIKNEMKRLYEEVHPSL